MNFWREGRREGTLIEMFCSEKASLSFSTAAAILETVSEGLLSAWLHVGPCDLSNE